MLLLVRHLLLLAWHLFLVAFGVSRKTFGVSCKGWPSTQCSTLVKLTEPWALVSVFLFAVGFGMCFGGQNLLLHPLVAAPETWQNQDKRTLLGTRTLLRAPGIATRGSWPYEEPGRKSSKSSEATKRRKSDLRPSLTSFPFSLRVVCLGSVHLPSSLKLLVTSALLLVIRI